MTKTRLISIAELLGGMPPSGLAEVDADPSSAAERRGFARGNERIAAVLGSDAAGANIQMAAFMLTKTSASAEEINSALGKYSSSAGAAATQKRAVSALDLWNEVQGLGKAAAQGDGSEGDPARRTDNAEAEGSADLWATVQSSFYQWEYR